MISGGEYPAALFYVIFFSHNGMLVNILSTKACFVFSFGLEGFYEQENV